MSRDQERASDREREQAVSALRDDLVAGRLTLEEFSERVDAAYRANVLRDLARLRDDLPEQVMPSGRRPVGLSAGVFGHLVRRGRLRLRRRSLVVSAFADVDFDLRDASLESEHVVVRVLVVFGNADLYVPEGIDVESGGTLVFGRQREWGRDTAARATPRLSVRAYGLFGTVDVWRVPRGMRGSYGEVMRQLEQQQQQR